MFRNRYLVSLVLSYGVLASPQLMADPSVNGNVISWPDDGWYQVQTSDGATTLCGGGRSCEVSPGDYLVINHTLGIRYTDVHAGGQQGSDAIEVNGQVISWPDDGWYQVQSAGGLVTYCNGGSSCTVEPGYYQVINHSTGQRFDNIVVGDDAPVMSSVTVVGQRISWPDDGWYQVQTDDGRTSLCNGGSFCDVTSGTYLVINHTTGVRYHDIVVTADDPVNEGAAVINRDNHIDLLRQVFSVYTGRIYGDTLPGIPEGFMESHTSVEVEVPEEVQSGHDHALRHQYACDNGGVLEHTVTYGVHENTDETFSWENCLDGDIIKRGTLNSWVYEYGRYYRDLITSDYVAEYADGDRVEVVGVHGDIIASDINPATKRINRWIHNGFSYTSGNESTELSIRNAVSRIAYIWNSLNTDEFTASLNGSFELASVLTDQQTVTVETNEPLGALIEVDGSFTYDETLPVSRYPEYPDWAFTTGVLEMTAEDGSALRLEADSGDEQTAQITLLQNDVLIETFQQPWSLWTSVLEDVQPDPRSSDQ